MWHLEDGFPALPIYEACPQEAAHRLADQGGQHLGAGLHKIFFVHERQIFEQKLSMKVRKFNYWLTRNKTP